MKLTKGKQPGQNKRWRRNFRKIKQVIPFKVSLEGKQHYGPLGDSDKEN